MSLDKDSVEVALVVDDNEAHRYTSSRALRLAGFQVVEAATGNEALRLAARQPNVIILDVNLPDISGFDVCRKIRASPITASIPVLHLSATHIDIADKVAGLEGGADAYLTHPASIQELIATVKALIRTKKAEDAARLLAAQWQTTFDAISDGVALLDATGEITRSNRALHAMAMDAVATVDGQPLWEVIAGVTSEQTHAWLQLAAETGQSLSEIEVLGRWLRLCISPVTTSNAVQERFVSVISDVTLAHAAATALRDAKDAAEDANRAKSDFLANMSHELRTPLGAVLGYTELLKDENAAPSERLHFIETISRNGHELGHLLDDILDLSKVEAGKVIVEAVAFSFNELIANVSSTLENSAREKGIELLVELAPDIPPVVVSDPTRVRQILFNVVGNAVKFTDRGNVKLSIQSSTNARDQHGISIVVEDTGCGIPAERRGKLFEPFMQADSSTTRRYGGTGLGLALSKRLARMLGGDVRLIRSEPGRGSTFLITLPIGIAAQGDATNGELSRLTEHEAPASIQLTGVKVLLAEDAPDNQFMVKRFLTLRGALVDIVDNGQQAVERALGNKYDVVLMDIQMPLLDGYEATRRLRAQGYSGPIIALTAHAMLAERQRSLAAGCDDHLTKPIHQGNLIRTVAEYARRLPARRQTSS